MASSPAENAIETISKIVEDKGLKGMDCTEMSQLIMSGGDFTAMGILVRAQAAGIISQDDLRNGGFAVRFVTAISKMKQETEKDPRTGKTTTIVEDPHLGKVHFMIRAAIYQAVNKGGADGGTVSDTAKQRADVEKALNLAKKDVNVLAWILIMDAGGKWDQCKAELEDLEIAKLTKDTDKYNKDVAIFPKITRDSTKIWMRNPWGQTRNDY